MIIKKKNRYQNYKILTTTKKRAKLPTYLNPLHLMSTIDLYDIIPKLIENISFSDYLSYLGYIKRKSPKKEFDYFTFENEGFKDMLFISSLNGVENYHSLSLNDSGDVIRFTQNRYEALNPEQSFSPSKDLLIEAVSSLLQYSVEYGNSNNKIQSKVDVFEFQRMQQSGFTTFYSCKNLFDYRYLKSINIPETTYNHPFFEHKIYNTIGLVYNKEEYNVVNIAYPLTDYNDVEYGLQYENSIVQQGNNKKSKDISFFAENSVKSFLWISNTPQKKSNEKLNLTLTRGATEALAHFSFFSEKRKYIGIYEYSENTFWNLKQFINRETVLYLALDIEMSSFKIELQIICDLLEHNISIVKDVVTHIFISIDMSEQQYFKRFLNAIFDYNKSVGKDILNKLGTEAAPYVRNQEITVSEQQNSLEIKIPKNYKTLYFFEKALVKYFPNHIPIKFDKPKFLNWKTQNAILQKSLNEGDKAYEKFKSELTVFTA